MSLRDVAFSSAAGRSPACAVVGRAFLHSLEHAGTVVSAFIPTGRFGILIAKGFILKSFIAFSHDTRGFGTNLSFNFERAGFEKFNLFYIRTIVLHY